MPIPRDNIPAASGVDLTSNPSSLPNGRAQALVGYMNDREGLLRAAGMFSIPTGLGSTTGIFGLYTTPGFVYTLDNLGIESHQENAGSSLTYPPTFTFVGNLGLANGAGPSDFISFQNEIYVINGSANTRLYAVGGGANANMGIWNWNGSGNKSNNLAITLNTDAVAGNLNGTYQWFITQVDSLNRESSPGAVFPIFPATETVSAKQVKFNLPVGSYDLQTTSINLYRTLAGGSVYYRVGNIAIGTATFIDNVADTTLALQPVAPNFGENNPPYPATWVFVHQNRLVMDVFGAGGTGSIPNCSIQMTNVGSATQVANPTGVDGNGNPIATDGGIYQLINDNFHHVVAGCSFGSVAGLWLRDQRWVLYGTDATNYQLYYIDARGCIATNSLVVCNNFVCWLSEDGVYLTSYSGGFNDEKLSGDLDALIFGLNASPLGRQSLENSFAWFCDNAYCLYIPGLAATIGGLGSPGTIWRFDFNARQKGWTSFSPGFAFSTVSVMTGVPGQVELAFLGASASPFGVYLFDVHNVIQTIAFCEDQTRVLQVPGEDPHDHWKKLNRLVRFGTGTYSTAFVAVRVDGRVINYGPFAYPAIVSGDASIGALLEQEFTDDVIGYIIDVTTVFTNAVNLSWSSTRLDYVLQSD